jgi:hypothetical protein
MLSAFIGEEQFGFLHNRQIHDAVSITQEVLHSVKKKNLKATILKLDLSKAYDRVNWTFYASGPYPNGHELESHQLDNGVHSKHFLFHPYQ